MVTPRTVTIGVSLKMYFDPARTAGWCAEVAGIVERNEAVQQGRVALFVLPSLTAMPAALDAFRGSPVAVGAQDLHWEDRGPVTGGISGTDLRQLGCEYVEIGHEERRRMFGEDDRIVGAKLRAALRNGLRPVVCVGETDEGTPGTAAATCIAQLEAVFDGAEVDRAPVVVAYEPVWAIGRGFSADAAHVAEVAAVLRGWLDGHAGISDAAVVYGGSAGPGLLPQLDGAVDGLFLGRFAHDPAALSRVLDEAATLR